MTRQPPPRPDPRNADGAPPAEDVPDIADTLESADAALARRPDGWYWTAPDGRQDVGPFDTREQALADMQAAEMDDVEPDDTLREDALREAEDELGIADFIDPDTGEPAEGLSNPHLPRDG